MSYYDGGHKQAWSGNGHSNEGFYMRCVQNTKAPLTLVNHQHSIVNIQIGSGIEHVVVKLSSLWRSLICFVTPCA